MRGETFRVSVPRRGSADGATTSTCNITDDMFKFQSPEGEVLTVQRIDIACDMLSETVSVPRRGSADGATEIIFDLISGVTQFQSPEGEVLTVQLISAATHFTNSQMFQSPEGEVLTVQHGRSVCAGCTDYVSVPRRGSADGATHHAHTQCGNTV
mgnify:CR=1 FL=1